MDFSAEGILARMKAAFRVLPFSAAVRERTAVMSPAAKRSTDF